MAACRTGLTPHLIRIWEKRYGAVQPARTGTNRRLYSEAEIERLNLLRLGRHSGHNISTIARLPIEKLRALAARVVEAPPNGAQPRAVEAALHAEQFIEEGLARIRDLDGDALDGSLHRAALAFGFQAMLLTVVGPLAQRIGLAWREGTITAAQEHFASARMRAFLDLTARPFAAADSSAVMVVATPAGQLHDLGAFIVAAAATNLGWRVACLGANLPAAEIARSAIQIRARAVALSIVYPDDDPGLPGELDTLRAYLPPEVALVVGGRAVNAYRESLEKIGAITPSSLSELLSMLDELRRPAMRR